MEENKNANLLCIISLVCVLIPVFAGMLDTYRVLATVKESIPFIEALISNISAIAVIAGIVLIIYVRVKYPKSIFGKVLMWVYIVAAIVIFLVTLLVILTCATACGAFDNNYQSFCDGCRALE